MIVGTGIDMVDVKRIEEKVLKGNGFTEKVFSQREVTFCESKPAKYEHYAARFAAKEAFLKATGKGLQAGTDLYEIEIVHDAFEKPEVVLHGNFKELALQNGWNKIHVSLTHIPTMACAVVILEQ